MATKNIKQTSHLNNIAIIGAGASGLYCAILLAKSDFNVTIYEKNTKIGRKILATGNGRCNISNAYISSDCYHSINPDFTKYILDKFSYPTFKKEFEKIGFSFIEQPNGKVFPSSAQSASVVKLLEYEAKELGIRFVLDTNITNIDFEQNHFNIYYNNQKQPYDKVIISTGSYAMPKLGSSNSGYKFAQNFGHNIVEPFASLVQLETYDNTKSLSGVKINSTAQVFIDKELTTQKNGDILFTDYGISGNAILDISRDVAYALQYQQKVIVQIDILPHLSKDKLLNLLQYRLKTANNKDKYLWLESLFHTKLIKYIVDKTIDKQKNLAKDFTKKDIMSLVYNLKNFQLNIEKTKGFNTAEVVAGGVDTYEIDNKSMQSKLQKNLYFTGEVVDVDGDCGGYNLHWAFATAYICATSITK